MLSLLFYFLFLPETDNAPPTRTKIVPIKSLELKKAWKKKNCLIIRKKKKKKKQKKKKKKNWIYFFLRQSVVNSTGHWDEFVFSIHLEVDGHQAQFVRFAMIQFCAEWFGVVVHKAQLSQSFNSEQPENQKEYKINEKKKKRKFEFYKIQENEN